jgi:hypothetical protein
MLYCGIENGHKISMLLNMFTHRYLFGVGAWSNTAAVNYPILMPENEMYKFYYMKSWRLNTYCWNLRPTNMALICVVGNPNLLEFVVVKVNRDVKLSLT